MITVRLMGGLGNQMFQYAAGYELARRHKVDLRLELALLRHRLPGTKYAFRDYDLDIFTLAPRFTALSRAPLRFRNPAYLTLRLWEVVHRKLTPWRFVSDGEAFRFDPEFADASAEAYLVGHFQHLSYFSGSAEEVRKLFTSFRKPLGLAATELLKRIEETNSVCINYRRTDYVHNPTAHAHHRNMDKVFYDAAQRVIEDRVPDPHYFIFSDDIEWCEANVRTGRPTTFVRHDCAGPKFSDYFRLMMACRHFIVPNSTFAWWAAWLNPDTTKAVVAPRTWLATDRGDATGILPEAWTTI